MVELSRALVVAAFPAIASLALAQQITVGTNVQVSKQRSKDAHYELLAGADPANPTRMMACSMVHDASRSRTNSVVYTTTDGGQNWRQTLEVARGWLTGDPVCMYGLGDTAFVVLLTVDS